MELGPREPDPPGRIDMRGLWRLTGWGVAAALALGVLAATTQTYTGSQRLKLALTPPEMPVRKVAVVDVPPRNDAEMGRLQAEINVLTADRDRLATRVASLERSLDDLTGSIRQLTAAAEPKSASQPATPAITAESSAKPAAPAAEPPPKPAMPETVPASGTPLAEAPQQRNETKTGEPAGPAAAASEDAAPTPSDAGPATAAIPLPAARVAELPPKAEFGIALAGASSVGLLQMQWSAVKANFGPLVGELKPHALHERRGSVSHYRLIIGPLPTYTAAAKLCARLIAAHAVCRPVKMAGEPL